MAEPARTTSAPTAAPIRVMLVDDSAVVRGLIARALEQDKDFNIVTTAANGKMAITSAMQHQPEVIVLDIEMPEMDGIAALPELVKAVPGVKVIMASTLTLRNASISMEALSKGAVDYVAKPTAREKEQLDQFYRELKDKIRAWAQVKRGGGVKPVAGVATPVAPVTLQPKSGKTAHAVAIASSTGGPQALMSLFGGLKGQLKHVPIFITQHMPPTFTTILADQLSKVGDRPCHEAKDGMAAEAGHAYIAPGDFHMIARREGTGIVLNINQEPPVNFCRPAADPMLESLSKIFSTNLLAVVLTGMGQDGLGGCKIVVAGGGAVLAQDEATSVVWGMPKAVAENNLCQAVLPLAQMAEAIVKRC